MSALVHGVDDEARTNERGLGGRRARLGVAADETRSGPRARNMQSETDHGDDSSVVTGSGAAVPAVARR